MNSTPDAENSQLPGGSRPTAASGPAPRVFWPVLLVALFWAAYFIIGALDRPIFTKFLLRLIPMAVLTIGMGIWWFASRGFSWKEKMLVPLLALASAAIGCMLMDRSVLPPTVIIPAWQALLTAGTIWLVATQAAPRQLRLAGLLVLAAAVWIPLPLVRMEGLRGGSGAADLHWRWQRSAEAKYLAEKKTAHAASLSRDDRQDHSTSPLAPLAAGSGDWTQFRGPKRNGAVRGITIHSQWRQSPPKLVWQKRVGPGWSSITVVGDRLFTQEQRGEKEAVICCRAKTGEEVWAHEDPVRFEEALGGIGPRATPTFADGRVYVQGTEGLLHCLDAATGQALWSRDIAKENNTELPVWGYSISPLMVDGLVICFAGDKPKNVQKSSPARDQQSSPDLLAYDAQTGELKWSASTGKETYSSPQLVTIRGVPQVLMLSDTQLAAFDPPTGKRLWSFATNASLSRPTIQPQQVGDDQLVVSFSPDAGVSLLQIKRAGHQWSVTETWSSRDLKPDFSDLVYHDGHLYGFDNDIFCCLDLETGKRRWKRGRYGSGQVLLLADQPALLVITEQGELVLVAANPQRHEELARLQAITGKTWNHPVIAHGRLYVRNAQEMACYALPLAE